MHTEYALKNADDSVLNWLGLALVLDVPVDTPRGVNWVDENMNTITSVLSGDHRIIPGFMKRKKRTTTHTWFDDENSLYAVDNAVAEARVLEELKKLDATATQVTITQRPIVMLEAWVRNYVIVITAQFG
jgi:hypothetical protein